MIVSVSIVSRFSHILIFFVISVYIFLLNGFLQIHYGMNDLANSRRATVGGKILCLVLLLSEDDVTIR